MAEQINDASGTPKNSEDVKTFTQEEVNNMISERVNRLNATKQKDLEDALAKARAEWEESKKIESLSGQEKMQAEFDAKLTKARKDQETLNKELAEARTALAVSKAQAQLASLDLPTEFAERFIGENDEQTSKNIQLFDAKVKELVAKKVNESISRGSPRLGTNDNKEPDWQAQIKAAMHVQ